ncbi:MAG TPA: dienelactone hydrolase family protein [Allosphingosinicella sp.]|jgi:carboxymethylenebutenolidase|nr:dienelactone hydrolase family protein [Allosphingosinicella sp.]
MTDEIERAAIALYDRFTHEGMDRRLFMARLTRIAGSAAAASMLLGSIAARAEAPPIVPADDPRIRTRELNWEPRPGRRYTGYEATPAQARRNRPVVLVVHENRGLNDHIRDVARRLAVAGYSAVAPDFLSPAGGTPAGDEDRARTMIGALDMAETVADGAATIGWLASAGGGARKVGMVGFCWGGGLTNRLAIAAGAALKAAVPFYGPAPDPAEAARVQAAMLIILAGLDNRVNGTARPWAEALRAAGKDVTVHEFPNVDHAFHNDTSAARYNREAATQAWAETLAFFRRHLA